MRADNAKEAEEKARDRVLFDDTFALGQDDITDKVVGWVDTGEPVALQVIHLEGCWGNHCRHYGCVTDETAIDHHAYCSQCDLGAY